MSEWGVTIGIHSSYNFINARRDEIPVPVATHRVMLASSWLQKS
jgi:hypothetical protein